MELEEYKDMYGIYWRIKEIRPTYKLFLNRKTGKIELHDANFIGANMVFDLPIFPNVIDKINATRIENANYIFRKIDAENRKNDLKIIENASYFVKNQLNPINF